MQVAGSRPEDATCDGALFRSLGLLRLPVRGGLRRGVQLLGGFFLVGVVSVVLLLLKSLCRGNLFCGGLLAGGQKFFQGAAGHGSVGVESRGREVVGMRDHAGGGVRGIADVAAFEVDVLAIADVGHADDDVLRITESGREERQQHCRANFQRETGACNAAV